MSEASEAEREAEICVARIWGKTNQGGRRAHDLILEALLRAEARGREEEANKWDGVASGYKALLEQHELGGCYRKGLLRAAEIAEEHTKHCPNGYNCWEEIAEQIRGEADAELQDKLEEQ